MTLLFWSLLLLVALWFVVTGVLMEIEQSRRAHKPVSRPRWEEIARK